MKENPYQEDREQLQELLKTYENLKNGRGHSFIEEDSFEKIVDHFQESDDLVKAMEVVETAIEQYPYSAMLLIKKADILLAIRKYKEALKVLEQASLFDSADINLFILKTDAYLALDQPEKAIVILEEALSLFEGEERIELLFELADVYDDYEEFDKVFDCLKMILTDEPNNEEALYKICFWTDYTGNNEASIRLHLQIIDEYPYNELAWFNLAAAYQGLKLYEKAIDAYQYAITIDEKFDFAYRNMGDAYIRIRKYKEAIEALEKVMEIAKPEYVIFEAIGHCYDRLKKYAQARFFYRKASHMREEDSKLLYKIACTYYNEKNWNSCFKQLENAMRFRSLQPDYLLLAGECKLHMGHNKEAVQYFSTVVQLKPNKKNGWEALIRCLYKMDLFDEALEQTNAALEITKGFSVLHFYKAAILLAAGKKKKAVLQLEFAMNVSAKQIKKLVDLNPSILQHQAVIDVLSRYKNNKLL